MELSAHCRTVLERGGKRSATPLWARDQANLRSSRFESGVTATALQDASANSTMDRIKNSTGMRLRAKHFLIFSFGFLLYNWIMTILERSSAAAFSLVELMIVVALIVVVYAMWMSSLSGSRQRTKAEGCSDHLQKIFLAAQIYENDFGKFPLNTNARTSEAVLDLLVPRYTSDTSIFICPEGTDWSIPSGDSLNKHKISYAYYMGRGTNAGSDDFLMSDRQYNTLSKNAGDQVFSLTGWAPGNNHGKYGGNVLFCDGHVQNVPPRAPFSLAFSNDIVLLNPKP